jgi:7-carboxy-7-deazaguanine synthase
MNKGDNMVKQIIKAYPERKRTPEKDGSAILHISENFCDTVQGEGINIGQPATFLRMQFCTLNCIWCDTREVWRQGNQYTVLELVKLWEKEGVIKRLRDGQHLILTGGSPLKQQDGLTALIRTIEERYNFLPYIEIENECMLMPNQFMIGVVKVWNNSPKLKNSSMRKELRFKPHILKKLSSLKNSWFKFVLTSEKDWKEIKNNFLDSKYIRKEQVVLMPEGITRKELQKNYEFVVKLACKHNVRMTDRLQVTIWDKTTGV